MHPKFNRAGERLLLKKLFSCFRKQDEHFDKIEAKLEQLGQGAKPSEELIAEIQAAEAEKWQIHLAEQQKAADLKLAQKLQKLNEQWRQKHNAGLEQSKELKLQLGEQRQQYKEVAQQCDRQRKELQLAAQELAEAKARLAQVNQQLPDLAELVQIANLLSSMPRTFAPVAKRYYNMESLPLFLIQLGQFAKLRQFWEACREEIMAGTEPENIGSQAAELLKFYSEAFACGDLAISPKIGASYDFNTQGRLGPAGATIQAVLFPGLKNPAGEIIVKALVRLQ